MVFFVPIRHNICAYDHLRIWGICGDHLSDLGAAGAQMVPLKRRRRLLAVGEALGRDFGEALGRVAVHACARASARKPNCSKTSFSRGGGGTTYANEFHRGTGLHFATAGLIL